MIKIIGILAAVSILTGCVVGPASPNRSVGNSHGYYYAPKEYVKTVSPVCAPHISSHGNEF